MSIFNMFKSAPAPTPTESASTTNSNATQGTGDPEQVPTSTLDSLKDLWDTKNADGAEPTNPGDLGSLLDIDPAKIQETVNAVDFSQVIPADTMNKIAEGGEQAQHAFAAAMNKVAQTVFSQSMIANATLVQRALANAEERIDARANNLMRSNQISETVSGDNEVFRHPAVVPIVKGLENQLAAKYPTASAAEISSKALGMFKELATSIRGEDPKNKAAAKGGTDWDSWLSS